MFLIEFDQTLDEGVYDPHIFKAVFMAGAPGSGKSTVAQHLFSDTGLKTINVDLFWHLSRKTGREINYKRFHHLTNKQKENWLSGRLGLLIDSTARNVERMKATKAELEKLGYETAMIFVNTSLETSKKRVLDRYERTGRPVPEKYVENTWIDVQKSLGAVQSLFGKNFYIIDNDEENIDKKPTVGYVEKSIHDWLNAEPENYRAQEWINWHKQNHHSNHRNTNKEKHYETFRN